MDCKVILDTEHFAMPDHSGLRDFVFEQTFSVGKNFAFIS